MLGTMNPKGQIMGSTPNQDSILRKSDTSSQYTEYFTLSCGTAFKLIKRHLHTPYVFGIFCQNLSFPIPWHMSMGKKNLLKTAFLPVQDLVLYGRGPWSNCASPLPPQSSCLRVPCWFFLFSLSLFTSCKSRGESLRSWLCMASVDPPPTPPNRLARLITLQLSFPI